MKEFKQIISGMAAAAVLTSCAGIGDNPNNSETEPCKIFLGFCEPVATTKSAAYDTNSFILSIMSTTGDTVYCGPYGRRPSSIQVKSGTYEIEALSREMYIPTFESPQYGDRQIVVVSNGQDAKVSLLCKRLNAGIKLNFTETFKKKYDYGNLLLMQPSGGLSYDYDETRTGYFAAGDVTFIYKSDFSYDTLFVKNVSAGEVHNLTLNASSDSSEAGFTLTVDDKADTLSQSITVGERYSGADGLTADTAYDMAKASEFIGDTVWVWGYVVGGDLTTSGINFNGPFTKSSNMAIASSPSERNRANCFSVELSRQAVKDALNLVDNPGNLGRKVFLRGVVSTYFSLTGLKGVTDFLLQ